MVYHYTAPHVVLSTTGDKVLANHTDGVLVDPSGAVVESRDPYGAPTMIRTSPIGTTLPFVADITSGRVRFGDAEAAVWCDETRDARPAAEAAASDAAAIKAKFDTLTAGSIETTHIYRGADGHLYYSPDPIKDGSGGRVERGPDGGLYAVFNV